MRTVPLLVLLLLPCPVLGQALRVPPEHPRLLIHRDDLPALRKRCGIEAYRNTPPADVRFGCDRAAFERVRRAADRIARFGAGPGELYAPALAHLVLGEPGRRDAYVERVESELRQRVQLGWAQDDVAIALDWCWDALDARTRTVVAARLSDLMRPLADDTSPLDHVAFEPRICDVATAIVLLEAGGAPPGTATRVQTILRSAQGWLEGSFIRAWQQKGPAATSPENGITSEADAVMAAEIWETGTGRPLWPKLADSLGRCAEPYFWAYTGRSNLTHGLPRDDGNWVPERPGGPAANWAAAVPLVLARRTGDPAASWFAERFVDADTTDTGRADALLWSRVVYGAPRSSSAFRQACPLGRVVPRGFVLMRTGWSPDAAVLLADVGQPIWRARQHQDAGHFVLFARDRLTTDSGEDVSYDAGPARGGESRVDDAFVDWDAVARATITHNCVTVLDPAKPPVRASRSGYAAGNQRAIEQDYRPSDPPVDETPRETGTLIAFETNSFYTYAAADLTPAYPPDVLRRYVRHFLLLADGALFICDRLTTERARDVCTWHLQLPERPQIDGHDLPEADRAHGGNNDAGIWTVAGADDWIDVRRGDGRLFVRTLWPRELRRCVVGGPKRSMTIPKGRWAGKVYVGSSADGYEHRLTPAILGPGPQGWYRLDEPVSLGPDFGLRSNWGRLDVAPQTQDTNVTFVHVLVPTDAATTRPPPLDARLDDETLNVEMTLGTRRCIVAWRLSALDGHGDSAGRVSVRDSIARETTFENDLATRVAPNVPLPGGKL